MTAIIMKFDFECEGGMKQCGKRFLRVTIIFDNPKISSNIINKIHFRLALYLHYYIFENSQLI